MPRPGLADSPLVETTNAEHDVGQTRRWAWAIAMAVGVVLVVVRTQAPSLLVDEVAYLAATLGGACLAWVGSRSRPADERTGWRWIAAGLGASALGDVVWTIEVLRGGSPPDVSWGDAFWLPSYIGLAAGVWLLVGRQDRDARIMTLLDTAAVGVMALLVVWQLAIVPTWGDASVPAAVRLVWSSYPVLDAVLLTLLTRLFVSRSGSLASSLLALGIGAWLASDFAFMFLATADAWTTWLDAGWMLGAVAMGAAALVRSTGQDRRHRASGEASSLQLAIGTLPILVPALLDVLGHAGGESPSPLPLLLATVPLAALIFLRGRRYVSGNRAIREELQRREHHFRALATNSSDAVYVVDRAGNLVSGGASLGAFLERAGMAPDAVAHLLASPGSHVRPADHAAWQQLLRRAHEVPGRTVAHELAIELPSGTIWVETRATDLTDDPAVGGIVVNVHDVTTRRMAEDQLNHQNLHDGLTGLPNRVLLRDRMDQALARTRRDGRHLVVVVLDLDGFKKVNDAFGHDAGDQLLCEVAHRLQVAVRTEDTVARLGGDEFAILVEDSQDPANDASVVTDRVRQALGEPITLDGRAIMVSASMGVAMDDHGASGVSLLRDADTAMYAAKSGGKDRCVVHEPDMQTGAARMLRLETDLRAAVSGDQLRLQYQPVVDLGSGHVAGFEALLRWEHPDLGRIPPNDFIGLAEDTGLIVPIGRWVLDTACRTLAHWQQELRCDPPLTIGVNLSARQLASDRIVDDVVAALTSSGLPPWALTLEVTETALVHDVATAAARLQELADLGVRLAIDDFGTGYSSLAYLRQFPVDVLKIDRSFIDGITEGERLPPLVSGMLDLAETLGLTTVAEGVELAAQRDQLRHAGCRLAQGYLFARPLDADRALDVVRSGVPGVEAHPAR